MITNEIHAHAHRYTHTTHIQHKQHWVFGKRKCIWCCVWCAAGVYDVHNKSAFEIFWRNSGCNSMCMHNICTLSVIACKVAAYWMEIVWCEKTLPFQYLEPEVLLRALAATVFPCMAGVYLSNVKLKLQWISFCWMLAFETHAFNACVRLCCSFK